MRTADKKFLKELTTENHLNLTYAFDTSKNTSIWAQRRAEGEKIKNN
jgi:hypothetical protein